jgi:FAD-dependent sensor of blue light
MSLACLVYIAKMRTKPNDSALYQHKDVNTRINARQQITGVLVTAGGYFFEIMEGDYAALESNLDRVSSSELMKEPEILIFTALKERQFKLWQMEMCNTKSPGSADMGVFQMLSQQAQADASSIPKAAKSMLENFRKQFADDQSGTQAA